MCLLVLFSISSLFAQEEQTPKRHNLKLAFEFGVNEAGCKLAEHERIRKDNYLYNNNDFLYRERWYSLRTTYFSLKPEYFFFDNRMGIASGLRFTTAISELVSDRERYSFLWRAQEEGYHTLYVRLNSLRQNSYLLGIPLEIKCFFNSRELPFQTYTKIGASFNFRINTVSQVDFTNKNIDRYKEMVRTQLSEGNHAFSSFAYAAIGFKIGKFREGLNTPWINIELQLPYILLTDRSFAFVRKGIDGIPGGGFQLSFQIPIGKNVSIGLN